MANALRYIKNVGKSVGYVAFDTLKELNPVFNDFAEVNSDFVKYSFKNLRDFRIKVKRLPKYLVESEYGELGRTLKNNIFEDLKSGKFYNRERKDLYENEGAADIMQDAAADILDDGESWEDVFKDPGMGGGFEDDEPSSNEMMDIVGEKAANAVSTTMARSAEYIVESNNEIARVNNIQNTQFYTGIHFGMSTINQNISKLLEFSSEVVSEHFNNSANFYTEISQLDKERNEYLKQISEDLKKMSAPEEAKENASGGYSDIINSYGTVDINKYIDNIKKNIANTELGAVLEMAKSFGSLKTMIHSPLSFIADGIVKSAIPEMLKTSMESINKTVSGLAANALLKLNKKAEEDETGLWSNIKEIFGIDTSLKTSIDTSKYNKGKIPFDGMTKKSIVEVIPTYLSKILAALTGKNESVYDFDKGTFTDKTKLKEEYDRITSNNATNAARGLTSEIKKKKDDLGLSKEQEKQFDEDWKKIVQYLYTNQMVFDTRDNKLSASSFGLEGGNLSDLNVKLFQHILDGTSVNVEYGNKLLTTTAQQTRNFKNMENGYSKYSALNNNSDSIGENKDDKGISSIVSNANKDVVEKLHSIYLEIVGIRNLMTPMRDKRKRRKNKNNINSPINPDNTVTVDAAAPVNNATTNGTPLHTENTDDEEDEDEEEQDDKPQTLLDRVIRVTSQNNNEKEKKSSSTTSKAASKANKATNTSNNENFNLEKLLEYHTSGKALEDKKKNENKEEEKTEEEIKAEEEENKNKKRTIFTAISDLKKGLQGAVTNRIDALNSVINKADQRLYDLVFGTKERREAEEDLRDRSLSEVLMEKLTETFDKFNNWVQETIIDPITERTTGENLKEAAKKFFGLFGIDMDGLFKSIKGYLFGDEDGDGMFTNFVKDFKSTFESVSDFIKNGFKETADWAGVTAEYSEQGQEKRNRNNQQRQDATTIGNIIANAARNSDSVASTDNNIAEAASNIISNSPEHATGIKRVNKTGLAVISEGEAIIPPDMNPFNIAKRRRNEKKVKERIKDSIDSIFEFGGGTSDGTTGEPLPIINAKTKLSNAKKSSPETYYKLINNKAKTQTEEEHNEFLEAEYRKDPEAMKTLFEYIQSLPKEKFTDKDYVRRGFFTRVFAEEGSNLVNSLRNAATNLNISEEDSEKVRKNAMELLNGVKDHGGTLAAGATIGAGVSLLTGLIVGPLVGAAIGAGTALITKSEGLQNMLFGEYEYDDKGNKTRKGGIISADLANNIHKYLPDMGKGATVGGILTALPLIPGSPVAGIIIGSALGFAKNNEHAQSLLFGEEGIFESKEALQEKVRNVLPKMGLGAAVGLLAGPFSLPMNLILGSAVGFASDTDAFKNLMFGEVVDEETGKREGGIVSDIVNPAIDFFKDMFKEFKEFMYEKMFMPIKLAIAPIKKQFEIIGKTLVDGITGLLNRYVGEPIKNAINRLVVSPMGKLFSFIFKTIKAPIKAIISSPFQLIGGIGTALRRRQVKKGNADYMESASLRNSFRKSQGKKMHRIGILSGFNPVDQFAEFDEKMENMSDDDISKAAETLQAFRDSNKSIDKIVNQSRNKLRKNLHNLDKMNPKIATQALKFVRDGDYDRAAQFIANSNLSGKSKSKALEMINKESAKIKKAKDIRDGNTGEIITELENLGLPSNIVEKLKKGDKTALKMLNYLRNEDKFRKENNHEDPIDNLNEDEQKRHEEVRSRLDDIINILRNKKEDIKDVFKGNNEEVQQEVQRLNNVSRYDNKLNIRDKTKLSAIKFKDNTKKVKSSLVKGTKQGIDASKELYKKKVRYSKFGNWLRGDDNIEWQNRKPKKDEEEQNVHDIEEHATGGIVGGINYNKKSKKRRPVIVSEGEAIIENVDDINEYATGGVVGNNKDNIFYIFKNMENSIRMMTKFISAMAYKEGINNVDNIKDTNDTHSLITAVRNKFKNHKTTQLIDGHVVTFTRDKDGNLIPDSGNAENNEYEEYREEQQNTQKGILSGIKDLSGNITGVFKKLFSKDEDEEDESFLSKIFGKVGELTEKVATPAKTAASVVAALGIAGWANEVIFPGLRKFWDEMMQPYLSDSWQGKQDGFGKFIYFFNPDNQNGMFPMIGKLFKDISKYIEDNLPSMMKTLSTYVSLGLEWAIREVLPSVVSVAVKNLPQIFGSLFKGLYDGLSKLLNRSKENDGKAKEVDFNSYISDNSSVEELNKIKTNKPSWFDTRITSNNPINTTSNVLLKNNKLSQTNNTTPIISSRDLFTRNLTDSSQSTKTNEAAKKANNIINTNTNENNDLPKAFSVMNQTYRDVALEGYKSAKDQVIQTPYGEMTVKQILNSDLQFGTIPDENGKEVPVYGYNMLDYYDTAQVLGIDLQLSQEQIKENTKKFRKEYGLNGARNITPERHVNKLMAKSFIRGTLGYGKTGVKIAGGVLKTAANVVAAPMNLLPGAVGKIASSGMKKIGSVADSALVGNYKNGERFRKAISKTPEAIKKLGEKATDSKLTKFIIDTTEALISAIKTSKIGGYIAKAVASFKNLKSTKTITSIIQKLADFIKDHFPTFLKKFAKEGAEAGGKTVLKNSAKLLGVIGYLAEFTTTFIYGYDDCMNILQITEEPPEHYKLITGLVNGINETFLFGIVPTQYIIDFVLKAFKFAGIDITKEVDAMRENAKEDIEELKKEHGIEFSIADYNYIVNDKRTFLASIGDLFKSKEEKERIRELKKQYGTYTTVNVNQNNLSSYTTGSSVNKSNTVTGPNTFQSSYLGRGSGIKNLNAKGSKTLTPSLLNMQSSRDSFISQVDHKYRNQKFNISGDTTVQTLGDTGCAPAAAAMAINATHNGNKLLTMEEASKNALKYKVKDDGVNATYFNDEFARNGLYANYITTSNDDIRRQEIARQLISNNKVVLMGQDQYNTSKKDSPFGPNPHYVVATGLSEDGKYVYINDPESRTPNVKYNADKVFRSSSLGISANVARGSVIGEKLKSFVINGSYGKIEEKATDSKLAKFIVDVTEAISSAIKVKKILDLLFKGVSSYRNLKESISNTIKSLSKFIKDHLPEFLKRFLKKGASTGIDALMKYTNVVGYIFDVVESFGYGYNECMNILGITEQPPEHYKLLTGLVSCINSMTGELIPTEEIIKFVLDALKYIGVDFSKELEAMQQKAREDVEDFKNKHGNEFTLSDYNYIVNNTLSMRSLANDAIFKSDKEKDKVRKLKEQYGTLYTPSTDNLSPYVTGSIKNKTSSSSLYLNGRGSRLFKKFIGRGSKTLTPTQLNMQSSNESFISQVDHKYRNKKFNISGDTQTQTLGDTGCAPAAAAMAINATHNGNTRLTMEEASKNALKYKVKDDGVNATYFNDEFARNGLYANYITTSNDDIRRQEIARQLISNNKVVLMGQDSYNVSKKDSPFGPNPHYVVATGLSEDGKYVYINDPESRTPNIRYNADRVFRSSSLGISANVARGSKLISNKIRKYVARGTYGPDTVQYRVWMRLRAAGYSEVQVAGVMGNIYQESKFDPAAVEHGSGLGYGLCQWTNYPRGSSTGVRQQLEDYAASLGKPPSDVDVQMDYLIAQMRPEGGCNGYAENCFQKSSTKYDGKVWAKDSFDKATTIEDATKAFCYCWEKPSAQYAMVDVRIQAAHEFYTAFTGKPVPADLGTFVNSESGSASADTQAANNNPISKILNVFSNLASAYGFGDSSSTSSNTSTLTPTGTVKSASGNVSANPEFAQKQRALVEKMYSVEGQLNYGQGNAAYPGTRNVDEGGGDCSSLVQWAYKNVLGVDPGSYTGAQVNHPNTYTVANTTADESKLQLGDLLLKDGHVEMYSGNNTMIGHGGGNDGKQKGPTVKPLDKSGKYHTVRRWIGFQEAGSGSGLLSKLTGRGTDHPNNTAYNNALRHVKQDEIKTLLPIGMEEQKINTDKVSVIQYNKNKVSDNTVRTKSGSIVYNGRASQVEVEQPVKRQTKSETTSNKKSELSELKAIVKLLIQIVTNTDQLNNIVKLLGDYMTIVGSSDGSKQSKENIVLAKQNLVNAMQSSKSSGPSAEILRLIEATEKVARQ